MQATVLFQGSGAADMQRSGRVTTVNDATIGRTALRLDGSPASACLRLPRRQDASLGAPGRFLYLQLRLEQGGLFAVHANMTAGDRSVHRATISNLGAARGEAARAKRSGGVQVFLPHAHDGWTLLAIDLAALCRQACRSPHALLRALQLGGALTVRCAFTSDAVFDWRSLPADVGVTASFDLAAAAVQWVPAPPEDCLRVAPPRRRPAVPHPALPAAAQRKPPAAPAEQQPTQPEALQPSPLASPSFVGAFSAASPGLMCWVPGSSSGEDSSTAAVRQQGELVFAAGPLIVGLELGGGTQQRHLQGHTQPLVGLAASADGGWLASAEEGSGAALRLWNYRSGRCVATVPGHAGGATCLDLSADGSLLASAGIDGQGRQEVAVWDVAGCWAAAGETSGAAGLRLLARSASGHNIQALRFVPWGLPGRLLSCGKNSVRVWHAKEGSLRGLSVPLSGETAAGVALQLGRHSLCGEAFTCVAFERAPASLAAEPRRAYVGTQSGALFTIDLEAREVVGVAQLHSAPLTAVAGAGAGVLVTGSADRLLRLWSGGLQQAWMEAQHEGAVTGISLSPDGLWVATATDSGALSLLDVAARRYSPLLRSHTAAVHAIEPMAQLPGEPQQQRRYCTAGADGTVRVWDASGHQQLLELTAPGETVLSIACHPSTPAVACGFQGGALRVFDAATAELAESWQHSGAVQQLAFARHGRLLLSLGEDGCCCCYNADGSYAPSSYLMAGFPLHATALAASQDGQIVAVAALRMAGDSSGGGSSSMAQPLIVLHSRASLQPALKVPMAGTSPVCQLQLMPDARHILAATADGRLRCYSCTDGALVLDVPRCLPRPCLVAALDPSGTFLVAGGAGGRLTALSLHSLHRTLPAACADDGSGGSAEVLASLPRQELRVPTGGAVLSACFLAGDGSGGGLRLLTAGDRGDVCCWAFHGQACNAYSSGAEPLDATEATLVLRQAASSELEAAPAPCSRQAVRPVLNIAADCSTAGALTSPLPAGPAAPDSLDSPAPRPLPTVLQQCLRERPPSAPPGRSSLAAAGGRQRQNASLPATPLRGGSSKEAPFWERQPRPAEATLLVTAATGGQRSSQVVRQERRLLITSPCKQAPGSKQQGQRTAEWADCAAADDLIPAHGAGQHLALQPPRATAQRVHGFDAAAGWGWLEAGAGEQDAAGAAPAPAAAQQRLLCYAAGNVVLCEDLAAGRQRHVARLPGDISALAVSADGRLAAAALRPSGGAGGVSADIHLLDVQAGATLAVLSHHSYAVTSLSFSPDGTLLASLGGSGGMGPALALWAIEPGAAELVAALQMPEAVAGLAWPAGGAANQPPAFYTAGARGLVRWQLEPEALSSTAVHLPAVLRDVPLTAVACVAAEEAEEDASGSHRRRRSASQGKAQLSTVLVGDGSGRVWRLEVDGGEDVRSFCLLAQMQGQGVSCLQGSSRLVAAGTAGGALALLAAEGGREQDDAWTLLGCDQLDGTVLRIHLDSATRTAAAATAAGTLFNAAPPAAPQVLLCGHQGRTSGWCLSTRPNGRGSSATMAAASAAGVAVWQLDDDGSAAGPPRAPLVEFCSPPDATHIALADDASCVAAAYADGSVACFDVAAARLRWRVAGATGQGGVVALALVSRLRGSKVLVASSFGSLHVLAGASGQLLHRCMQFGTVQDSGRRCPANFRLTGLVPCPTDPSVLALCGRRALTVCRAHWQKNCEVQPLGRWRFGPPDDGSSSSSAAGDADGAAAQEREPAVQVAFSRAHAGHLYCTDPSHPGHLLLLDYSSSATLKTVVAPLGAGAYITSLALQPGSEGLLAAGTSSGSVLLLRLESEAWVELAAHAAGAAVQGLTFTACGGRLYSSAGTATVCWEVGQ